ncbi:MAG: GNAT family N-acetyltransferase [Chlorobia bacterium]|nr:GNAT family N-acetyltransferase [Fimbriimonadaceae bacterium]
MLKIRTVRHGSPEYWETIQLRRRILRTPLGLDFDPEDLEKEVRDLHIAGFDLARLVGCLVLTPENAEDIKMRQVAVDDQIQGKGIGTELVIFSERLARDRGYKRMVLSARDTAVPFYERLKYAKEGDEFEEVTVPHWRMVKEL